MSTTRPSCNSESRSPHPSFLQTLCTSRHILGGKFLQRPFILHLVRFPSIALNFGSVSRIAHVDSRQTLPCGRESFSPDRRAPLLLHPCPAPHIGRPQSPAEFFFHARRKLRDIVFIRSRSAYPCMTNNAVLMPSPVACSSSINMIVPRLLAAQPYSAVLRRFRLLQFAVYLLHICPHTGVSETVSNQTIPRVCLNPALRIVWPL